MLQEQLNYTINWNTGCGEIDSTIMRINCCQNGKPAILRLYLYVECLFFFSFSVAAVGAFCMLNDAYAHECDIV